MSLNPAPKRPFVRPKKNLGQHFLTDLNIARKIVSALPAQAGDPVVEIGPGTGVLTRIMASQGFDLQLVELDPESVVVLEKEFGPLGVKVSQQSFLDWEPGEHLQQPAWFIGNLPYNISSPILFHLLENREWMKGGVFMVQKEVAERICSGPGNKEYGILSVLLQAFFSVKYAFSVSENVFFPKPRVKSAVFSLQPLNRESHPSFPHLKQVVKAGFNQRRKTLRNSFSGLQFRDFPEKERFLSSRAEQLGIEEWILLSQMLERNP